MAGVAPLGPRLPKCEELRETLARGTLSDAALDATLQAVEAQLSLGLAAFQPRGPGSDAGLTAHAFRLADRQETVNVGVDTARATKAIAPLLGLHEAQTVQLLRRKYITAPQLKALVPPREADVRRCVRLLFAERSATLGLLADLLSLAAAAGDDGDPRQPRYADLAATFVQRLADKARLRRAGVAFSRKP